MKATTLFISTIILFILLVGCNSMEKLPGLYKAKGNQELRLHLYSDGTFTLYNILGTVYRHPFEDASDLFWVTKGNWSTKNKKLFLTSDSNATYEPQYQVISSDSLGTDGFSLVFLDYKNDTIPSIACYPFDSLYFAGRYTKRFSINYQELRERGIDENLLTAKDTIGVAFVGYPRLHLLHGDIKNHSTTLQLFPKSNPKAFDNYELIIRWKSLIDKSVPVKFEKENTAGNNG